MFRKEQTRLFYLQNTCFQLCWRYPLAQLFLFTDMYPCCFSDVLPSTTKPLLPNSLPCHITLLLTPLKWQLEQLNSVPIFGIVLSCRAELLLSWAW